MTQCEFCPMSGEDFRKAQEQEFVEEIKQAALEAGYDRELLIAAMSYAQGLLEGM